MNVVIVSTANDRAVARAWTALKELADKHLVPIVDEHDKILYDPRNGSDGSTVRSAVTGRARSQAKEGK